MTRRAIRTSSCSSSRRADRAKTTEYSGTPPALPTQNSFLYTLQGFSRLGRPGVSQGTVVEVLPQATLLLEVDLHSCLAACRVNYKLNAFHAFSSSLRHTALAPDRVLQGVILLPRVAVRQRPSSDTGRVDLKAPAAIVTHDATGRGVVEVRAQDGDGRVGVHLDELGEAGLQHRRHAVGQDAPRVLVALARPVLPLAAGEEVAGRPPSRRVFQPT